MDDNISRIQRDAILTTLDNIADAYKGSSKIEAFTNKVKNYITAMKYGLVFEHHQEQVDRLLLNNVLIEREVTDKRLVNDEGGYLNFLIEGDNLHALKILNKTGKRLFDLIYIDPPFNTGAKDWKYNNQFIDKNDAFRHSKWLSMMNARIREASLLLKKDGVFICAIDENELCTLFLLLKDIFGDEYVVDIVTIIHNPRGVQGDNFSYVNEYALFVYRKGIKAIEDTEIEEDDIKWSALRNWGGESARTDAANCFYPIIVKDEKIIGFGEDRTKDDSFHPLKNVPLPDGSVEIWPIDAKGEEHKWRYARDTVESIRHLLRVTKDSNGCLDIEIGKTFGTFKTVWANKKFDANEYGTKLINDMVPECEFPYPKSLFNVYECLLATVKNKPNARVLDFFAGSGTTGHAVLLMNKLLGGNRTFVLATNNDVGEKREKEFCKEFPEHTLSKNVPDTECEEWIRWQEKYGIATSTTYPRLKAAIEGYATKNGSKSILFEKAITLKMLTDSNSLSRVMNEAQQFLKSELYESTSIDVRDGFIRVIGVSKKGGHVDGLGGNLVYLRSDFIKKKDEEYLLSERLIKHIPPLIELYSLRKFDPDLLVVNEDQYEKNLANIQSFSKKTIYLYDGILVSEDDRKLFEKYGITVDIVPDAFYGQEMKEAGEKWSE